MPRTTSRRPRKTAAAVAAALLSGGVVTAAAAPKAAHAWKPLTHVYLADQAVEEAVRTGSVTIETLEPKAGGGLERRRLGSYKVDPTLRAALSTRRPQFRAGVLGPDAYPDILTGQRLIHDDGHDELAAPPVVRHPVTGKPLQYNRDPDDGSNIYLKVLYNSHAAPGYRDPAAIRAFTYGYLTHAAGDMFVHTFINRFSGGAFEMGHNGVKHVVLEGYLGERAPGPVSREASIAGCEGFIYDTLVNASYYGRKFNGQWRRGNMFYHYQGRGLNSATSLPAVFSRLRDRLQHDVDEAGTIRRNADPVILYKKAWIADIDDGLRAWPATSHKVAYQIMLDPETDGREKREKITRALTDYFNRHLLRMAGAPDVVSEAAIVSTAVTRVLSELGLLQAISEMKRDFVNYLFRKQSGRSLDEWMEHYTNPTRYFDRVLGPGSPGQGVRTTRADFNETHLGLAKNADAEARWSIDTFAPAYNTVVATKLLLLSKAEQERLLTDLKVRNRNRLLLKDNLMLGFLRSLDDGEQWRLRERNPGAGVARNWVLYDAVCADGRRAFDRLFYPMSIGYVGPATGGEEADRIAGGDAPSPDGTGAASRPADTPPAGGGTPAGGEKQSGSGGGIAAALGEKTRGRVGERLTDTLWSFTVTKAPYTTAVYTRRNSYYGEDKVEAGEGEEVWVAECDVTNLQPADKPFGVARAVLYGADGTSLDLSDCDLLHGGARTASRAVAPGTRMAVTLLFKAPPGFRPKELRVTAGNLLSSVQTEMRVGLTAPVAAGGAR